MLKSIKEFQNFALRGNMVDMAVGIIIGAAFSKVVNSLVADMIMPPIGLLIGGVDFNDLALHLQWPGSLKPPVELRYGAFLNNIINLFIISLSIFLVIKLMNRLYKKEPETKKCPECAMSIPCKAKKCGFCCSVISNS